MRNKLTPGFRTPNSSFERGLQNYKMLKYLCPSHYDSYGKGHGSFWGCVLPAMNGRVTDMFILEVLIFVAQCFSRRDAYGKHWESKYTQPALGLQPH